MVFPRVGPEWDRLCLAEKGLCHTEPPNIDFFVSPTNAMTSSLNIILAKVLKK